MLARDSFDGKYLVRLRTSLRLCLSASVKDQEFTVCVDQYFSDTKQALPNWFTPAFELFLKSEGEFRASLRILLRNLISETSVSTLVPLVLLEPLRRATSQFVSSPLAAISELNSVASSFPYGHIGILPEIRSCIQHAERRDPSALSIVAAVIIQLGEDHYNFLELLSGIVECNRIFFGRLHAHAIYACTRIRVDVVFDLPFSLTGFRHLG